MKNVKVRKCNFLGQNRLKTQWIVGCNWVTIHASYIRRKSAFFSLWTTYAIIKKKDMVRNHFNAIYVSDVSLTKFLKGRRNSFYTTWAIWLWDFSRCPFFVYSVWSHAGRQQQQCSEVEHSVTFDGDYYYIRDE